MKWTSLSDLRKTFLDFFESKDHKVLESFPLVPRDDNSLLLINSGMAPMKKYFTGEVTPPKKRVATCQKCIRTPDIERVGITARHGTFFEMLGNFSFGDYFKTEACLWAWEFCTQVLKLPIDKLWVSIYENDDEAFEIWTQKVGVLPERIVRLGKEDNFWEHGVGPCGPCSELYFDRGPQHGCDSPDCKVGCDCDRYVEFWNLVFTQFDSDGKGNYTPLEHPNIDTGMGLERLACIMQNVDNLFLVDTVRNVIKTAEDIAGIKYGASDKTDVSLRIIADHARSASFMIADGVIPSNEGRGYVLRRLIRRAARQGTLLGIKGAFIYKVCKTVINENKDSYRELEEKSVLIEEMIKTEEETFGKRLNIGLQILNELMEKSDSEVFSGEDAFKLNDTYGFPIDLTEEIIAEKGMKVDRESFEKLMKRQKELARSARKDDDNNAWSGDEVNLGDIPQTQFLGYDDFICEARVLAIVKDNKRVESCSQGEKVSLIFDKTTMYAQGGGQVGDIGVISTPEFDTKILDIQVFDTLKNVNGIYIHHCTIEKGSVKVGDAVKMTTAVKRRMAITRNHTAAHLLQAALRKVLGDHVEQAGQLVNDSYLRFDFTHFSAMTKDEIKQVESIVNAQILKSVVVDNMEMPISEARKLGAMALFGEKYGDVVRVVKLKDNFSIELCGGTHVKNTSQIGLFKIISENSIASGVRRITANTGLGVLKMLDDCLETMNNCAAALKVSSLDNLVNQCKTVMSESKNKDKEIEKLKSKLSSGKTDDLFKQAVDVLDFKLITAVLENTPSDELRNIADKIKENSQDTLAVVACLSKDKANFMCTAGKNVIKKGVHCGKLIKEIAAITNSKGGGRPDFAMAGIKDTAKIDTALKAVENIILTMIK
ncbi:MAG: alanine--tRNA ligase [Clostridia bacterium]|nr:alanine--tRNA ligase [Clostridia bacterium]